MLSTLKWCDVRSGSGFGENAVPQRQYGGAFRRQFGLREMGGCLVQPGAVLHAAQCALGGGRRLAHAGGQQTCGFSALQQCDIAPVLHQFRVGRRL